MTAPLEKQTAGKFERAAESAVPVHTPEPWDVGPWIESMGHGVYANIGHGGDRIASVTVYGRKRDSDKCAGKEYADRYGTKRHSRSVPQDVAEANARRIVACVNALEGFSTEELEAAADFLRRNRAAFEKAQARAA